MSVNVKQNGDLVRIANNYSIIQADWNEEDINKSSHIKNQPTTLKTLDEIAASSNEGALAGATALKELMEKLDNTGSNLDIDIKLIDGVPHWSERGADSWSPFSSGSTSEIEIIPLVPTLTSNTGSDGGEIITDHDNSNAPWWQAFDGTTDTISASNSATYVGYKFTIPTVVTKVTWSGINSNYPSIDNTAKLCGSNNGNEWVEICVLNGQKLVNKELESQDITNKTAYMYYKIVLPTSYSAGFSELQFYGYKCEAAIPIMTSDTTPSGIARCDSYYNGYPAYKAFTGLDNTAGWFPATVGAHWISYEFVNPKVITACAFKNNHFEGTSFILQGSNNDTDYVDLGTVTVEPSSLTYASFNNDKAYKYYKLYFENATINGNGYKLQLYAAPEGINTGSETIIANRVLEYGEFTLSAAQSIKITFNKTYDYRPIVLVNASNRIQEGYTGGYCSYTSELQYLLDGQTTTGNTVNGVQFRAMSSTYPAIFKWYIFKEEPTNTDASPTCNSLKGKSATSLISANVNYHIIIPTCGYDIKVTFSSLDDDMGFWGSNNGLRDEANVALTRDASTNIVSCKEYDFLLISAIKGGSYTNATYEWV